MSAVPALSARAPARGGPLATVGWAVYLASSWTWCIGMYLPTLLVRDAGKLAFVAFIVPNAVGAGLVGWVLAGRGRAFAESKRPMILAFTAATIAFHGYWIVTRLAAPVDGDWALFAGGMLLGASLVLNLAAATGGARGLAAALTMLFSLGAAFALLAYPADSPWLAGGWADLSGIAAVCALGFGLCPYLDVTFHRCVAEARRPRAAFTIGFVLFAMVLLVVSRGRALVPLPPGPVFIDAGVLAAVVGAHFGAQTAFTVAAQVQAIRPVTGVRVRTGVRATLVPGLVGVGLGVAAVSVGGSPLAGMTLDELGYRAFLGLYGLVFPAWLVLTIGGRPATSRRTLTALAVVCAAALPFFVYGFVWLREVWLIPGVAIVLLGRALADRRRPA